MYLNERSKYLDILKGIAVILVVVGHSIQFGSGQDFLKNALYWNNSVFSFIYSFHMSLFMLISGYLFWGTVDRYTTKQIIINKAKRLIVPIFIWNGLFRSLTYLYHFRDKSFCYFLKDWFRTSFTELWFFWAIFYFIIIILIVNNLFRDNIFVYIGLYFILLLIDNSYMGKFHYKNYFIPFSLAYLFHKYSIQNKFKDKKKMIFISLINIISFVILYYFKDVFIINNRVLNNFIGSFHDIILSIVGSISLISLVYCVINVEKNNFIINILVKIGTESMGIYIIHGYFNQLILVRITKNLNYKFSLILIESILSISFSLLVIFVIKKFPRLRKLLLS